MGLPGICGATAASITFERIAGRHARTSDLRALAGLLGDAHGAAWHISLGHAEPGTAHRLPGGGLADCPACRRIADCGRGPLVVVAGSVDKESPYQVMGWRKVASPAAMSAR
jgi:hypothetical protein